MFVYKTFVVGALAILGLLWLSVYLYTIYLRRRKLKDLGKPIVVRLVLVSIVYLLLLRIGVIYILGLQSVGMIDGLLFGAPILLGLYRYNIISKTSVHIVSSLLLILFGISLVYNKEYGQVGVLLLTVSYVLTRYKNGKK